MTKEKTFENFTEHCFSSRLIDRLTEENQRLKNELDKQIKDNRKLVKTLKMYADYNFYNVKFNIYKSPLTNREEVYFTCILDKKGRTIPNRAQKVLKEIGEEE